MPRPSCASSFVSSKAWRTGAATFPLDHGKGNPSLSQLLCNDDGVYSPGLAVLEPRRRDRGPLCVGAPCRHRRGVSKGLTFDRPLRLCGEDPVRLRIPRGKTPDWIDHAGGAANSVENSDFHATASDYNPIPPINADVTCRRNLAQMERIVSSASETWIRGVSSLTEELS